MWNTESFTNFYRYILVDVGKFVRSKRMEAHDGFREEKTDQ